MSKRFEIDLAEPVRAALLAVILFSLTACSSPPHSRLEAADKALAAALAVEAERFAPELIAQARQLYGDAQKEIERQQERRLAARTFRRAELLLVDVERVARQAEHESEQRAARLSADARSAVDRAASAVESAAGLIGSLPTGLDTRHEAQQMRTDLTQLRNGLAAARAALDAGDIETAMDRASAVEARASRTARVVARALEHLVVLPADSAAGTATHGTRPSAGRSRGPAE